MGRGTSLIRRSLRARLLAWYVAALLAVVATFSALAVFTIWEFSIRDLDARLRPVAEHLADAVRRDSEGHYEVNISEPEFSEFSAPGDASYYGIWSTDHVWIDRSDPFVETTFPEGPPARTRNGRREMVVQRGDAVVMVGQSLAPLRSTVWRAATALGIAGAAALALACTSGWLLIGQVLTPIRRIARTAEAMSESNLGLRIDVTADDELGRVAGALNHAFDRLQDAFERQKRFTADASHELRTPLSAQLAELEWALARPRERNEYLGSLHICMRAAQRMRALVEGLLTLARADAGAELAAREAIDLLEVVRESVVAMAPNAEAHGVRLSFRAPLGVRAIVDGSAERLRELVSNLVANAVEYGHHGGQVVCEVTASGGHVTLDVIDDGPGIEPEDLPHIFERFYRANKARARLVGGAGLGLAISKWIVERHGGTITCTSIVGTGTRMTVMLPAAAAPPKEKE